MGSTVLLLAFSCLILGVYSSHVFVAPAHPSAVDVASLTSALGNVSGNLLACVGSGHALLSLRQDYRSQLQELQHDIGFGAIRFHAILDDDMSTFLNGEANMFNVFSSLDFLISSPNNIHPIIELSFMPELLALNSSDTVFHYKGGTSQPANWTAWEVFIEQFVQLCLDRYGLPELQTWKFEIWNEPNCGFLYPYGDGCCPTSNCGPQSLYFKLYTLTASAVKKVHPSLRVGGPATAQTGWLQDFVDFVQSSGAPCDFISTHLYPTDPNVPQTRDGFAQTIAAAAAIAQSIHKPLTVTEFNAGLGIDAADGPYASAFVIHQLASFINVSNVDTLSFWTFSDIFEEQGFISAPYSQQFGMKNIYNVPKPVYRAFQMVSDLNTFVLDGSLSVTQVTSSGNVDAIFANRAVSGGIFYMALTTNFDVRASNVTVSESVTVVFNVPSGTPPSVAQIELIDATHAYAKPLWVAAGSPTYPSTAQVQSELEASVLVANTIALTSRGGNNYAVTLQLGPYAVARIYFVVTQ